MLVRDGAAQGAVRERLHKLAQSSFSSFSPKLELLLTNG